MKDLKNKPLVEAILEIRWRLSDRKAPGFETDPNYRILLGRFFERVRDEYPSHEPLQSASLPDEMAAHVVQHRFRVKPNEWPLVQIGPGIVTLNQTDGYTWSDYRLRCQSLADRLVEAYPKRDELKIRDVTLRYLDAVECDFERESVFDFLRTKMRITVELPRELFEDVQVHPGPSSFNWRVSFPHKSPEGTVTISFAMGQRLGRPALIWETIIRSKGPQAPKIPEQFPDWLDGAHAITSDWFFKLIEGELERRFSGE